MNTSRSDLDVYEIGTIKLPEEDKDEIELEAQRSNWPMEVRMHVAVREDKLWEIKRLKGLFDDMRFRKRLAKISKQAKNTNESVINARDSELGQTLLISASKRGYYDICEYLVKHDDCKNEVDIDAGDIFGVTALMVAAESGHLPIVKLLVESDARLFQTDDDGWSAIHFANEGQHWHVMQYLLSEKGVVDDRNLPKADVNALTRMSESVFLRAVMNGHLEVVKMLVWTEAQRELDRKIADGGEYAQLHDDVWEADTGLANRDQNNALLLAVQYGQVDVVQYLVLEDLYEIKTLNKAKEDVFSIPISPFAVKRYQTPVFYERIVPRVEKATDRINEQDFESEEEYKAALEEEQTLLELLNDPHMRVPLKSKGLPSDENEALLYLRRLLSQALRNAIRYREQFEESRDKNSTARASLMFYDQKRERLFKANCFGNCAERLVEAKQAGCARAMYEEAIKLDPDSEKWKNGLNLANDLFMTQKMIIREREARLKHLHQSSAPTFFMAADRHFLGGDWEKALASYKQAAEADKTPTGAAFEVAYETMQKLYNRMVARERKLAAEELGKSGDDFARIKALRKRIQDLNDPKALPSLLNDVVRQECRDLGHMYKTATQVPKSYHILEEETKKQQTSRMCSSISK